MTLQSTLTSMTLREDEKTRDWLHRQIMLVAWKCFRVSASYGTIAGVIASIIVQKMAPGIPLTKHAIVIFIPVLLGSTFLINGAIHQYFRRRWELTREGIRVRGWQRFNIPWERVERIESRPVFELSGYIEIRVFVGKRPDSTEIIVRLSEEELRAMFESKHPQVSWVRFE